MFDVRRSTFVCFLHAIALATICSVLCHARERRAHKRLPDTEAKNRAFNFGVAKSAYPVGWFYIGGGQVFLSAVLAFRLKIYNKTISFSYNVI